MDTTKIPSLSVELLAKIKSVLSRDRYIPDRCEADKKKMLELGFKENPDYMNVYINKELKLVVKKTYITARKPRSSVPTIRISPRRKDVDFSGDYFWVVQPLVDVSDNARFEAFKILKNRSWAPKVDLHYGNVGMYDGKAVMFDW